MMHLHWWHELCKQSATWIIQKSGKKHRIFWTWLVYYTLPQSSARSQGRVSCPKELALGETIFFELLSFSYKTQNEKIHSQIFKWEKTWCGNVSMETHPEIDQVQQHTHQGCGSTCPPASCWGKNISSKFCGGNLQWPDGLYCTNFLYRRNIWSESHAWSCAWALVLLQTDARMYSVQQVQSFVSKSTKLFRF